MYLFALLFVTVSPLNFPADTIPEAVVVADKGIVISKIDSLSISNTISITEALNQSTSLCINDNGGFAGLKHVSMRGLGTSHTVVYYDGVRFGNIQTGQSDLEFIDLYNCDNAIIDYAQNSISFNTARPVFDGRKFAGSVAFTGGSQNSYIPAARLDFKLSDKVALSTSSSACFSRGDFIYGDGQRRTGNDISSVHAAVDLFGIIDEGDWHAKAFYHGSDRGTPGSTSWPSDDREQDKTAFAQALMHKDFSLLYSLDMSGKVSYEDMAYTSEWGDSQYGQTEVQVNSTHRFRVAQWLTLSMTADIWWDNLISSNYNASRLSALGATGAALRTGRFAADLTLEYNGAFDKGEHARNCVSPSMGLRYDISNCLSLSASGRRSYRVPLFNELYYVGYGNPDLKPEDAWSTDIGAGFDKDFEDRWKVKAQLGAFFSWLKDKIISAPSPENPNYWQPYNIGKVMSSGIDACAGIKYEGLKWKYGCKVSYSWQNAVDKTDGSDSYNQQIAFVPIHSISMNADVKYKGWGMVTSWNLRAGRYDGYGQMPDWNTLDLTLFKELSFLTCGPLTIKLIGRNITDCHYELSSGYPMPGICVYGGIDLRF